MSEEDKLKELWKLLAIIDLDFNWVLALASLTAQEIAVKRKLNELGLKASGDDFQEWAENLSKTMKNNGDEPPEILISIGRSYRHIRSKLVHDTDPNKVTEQEAEAILNNTIALIDALFINEPSQIDVDEFINSISASSLDEKVSKFIAFNDSRKKQIFKGIMNRLALSTWTEDYNYIFNFMQSSLNKLIDKPVLMNLLEIVIRKARNIRLAKDEEKLLSIILNFLKLDDIKEFIKKKGLVDVLLKEYERSWSFNVAGLTAEIISEIAELLTPEEINRVVEVALSNDQILYSWKARAPLEFILNKYKDLIPNEEADKLAQVLKNE